MQLVVKRRGSCESPGVTARNRREARLNVIALLGLAAMVAASWAVTYGPLARWPW